MMILTFHLIVNSRGEFRMVINKPNLKVDEISVEISIRIPRAIFSRPQLTAHLEIPASAITTPEVTVETLAEVKDAIQQGTGMNVTVVLAEAQNED